MIDGNLLLFGREGTLPAGAVRVVGQTEHVRPLQHDGRPRGAAGRAVDHFAGLLFSMSYADPVMRPLLDLEGLKEWLPGRASTATRCSSGPSTSPASTTRRRDHRSRLPPLMVDSPTCVDLCDLGLDDGGHLLIERALAGLEPGARVGVAGTHAALALHLGAWCRAQGHRLSETARR